MRDYDDSEAARRNDEDACQGCHRAAADIGDLCEACFVAACDHEPDWRTLPALAIDTETTGTNTEEDVVVELGAYECPEGIETTAAQRYATIVNPGRPIPEGASAVHGITDDVVTDAPSLADIAPRFLDLVRAAEVLVGYNAPFDFAILGRQLGKEWDEAIAGKVVLDPLDLVRSDRVGRYWKGKGRHKLESVAKRLRLDVGGRGAHSAGSDAQAAMRVLYALHKELPRCGRCAEEWLADVHQKDRARFEEWKRNNPLPETA